MPITKPMLGMKFVTNEKKPHTSGSGHADEPQCSGVQDRPRWRRTGRS